MWGHASRFKYGINSNLLVRAYLIYENLCSLNGSSEGLDVNLSKLAGEEGVWAMDGWGCDWERWAAGDDGWLGAMVAMGVRCRSVLRFSSLGFATEA